MQADAWKAQAAAGIDLIGLDATLYDQVSCSPFAALTAVGTDLTSLDSNLSSLRVQLRAHKLPVPGLESVSVARCERAPLCAVAVAGHLKR